MAMRYPPTSAASEPPPAAHGPSVAASAGISISLRLSMPRLCGDLLLGGSQLGRHLVTVDDGGRGLCGVALLLHVV